MNAGRLCKDGCGNTARKKGRDCSRCHMRAWRANRPMQAAYATLRDHACERGIVFTISFEEFEDFALKAEYIDKKGPWAGDLTVDRIDNLKGYVSGNLQPLTRARNSEKRAKYDAIRRGKMKWRAAA